MDELKDELENAVNLQCSIKWNDPDPVDGCCYLVDAITIGEEESDITYNNWCSTATVPNTELEII